MSDMQKEKEDLLRKEVSEYIAINRPISWVFIVKKQDADKNIFSELKGGMSDDDAFIFVKHIFKERPKVKTACENYFKKGHDR